MNYRNMFDSQTDRRWDEISQKLFETCIEHGLHPNMKLLDVGCGPLRVGIKLIDYLNTGNYYGIDANANHLDIGLNIEVPNYNLKEKIVIENFTITDKFDIEHYKTCFDMILVSGVFTHLTLNHFMLFMEQIKNSTKKGSKIITTFWICDEEHDITKPIEIKFNDYKKVILNHTSDPYFYKLSQIKNVVDNNLWEIYVYNEKDFKQSLLVFERKQ